MVYDRALGRGFWINTTLGHAGGKGFDRFQSIDFDGRVSGIKPNALVADRMTYGGVNLVLPAAPGYRLTLGLDHGEAHAMTDQKTYGFSGLLHVAGDLPGFWWFTTLRVDLGAGLQSDVKGPAHRQRLHRLPPPLLTPPPGAPMSGQPPSSAPSKPSLFALPGLLPWGPGGARPRRLACALAALLAALPARAGALEDLRTLLARPSGSESLRAAVELRTWNRTGDPKAPAVTQATARAWVEQGPQGLRCLWSPEQIQQARQETKGKSGHSNPAREAMAALDAPRLADYFDSARTMLKDLEHASLLEDRPDTLDGHAARLLVLRIDPDLGEEERKVIKTPRGHGPDLAGRPGRPPGRRAAGEGEGPGPPGHQLPVGNAGGVPLRPQGRPPGHPQPHPREQRIGRGARAARTGRSPLLRFE